MGGREQARDLQARPRGPGQDSTPGRPGDGSRDDVASVRAGEGPSDIAMSDRRSLLSAALGFVLLGSWRSVRELVILHAWLDTWSGLGAIVVGMRRHGYVLTLTHVLTLDPGPAAAQSHSGSEGRFSPRAMPA